MAKVDMDIRLSDDKTALEMTTRSANDLIIRSVWNPQQLDNLIERLANLRESMVDIVSFQRTGVVEIKPVDNPHFKISTFDNQNGILLSFRHPGLNWIDWYFSDTLVNTFMYEILETIKSKKKEL